MITYQNSTILLMIALPNQGILGKGGGLHTKQDYYSRYFIYICHQTNYFVQDHLPKQDLCKISYQKYYILNVQSRIKIYCHLLFLWALIKASIS